MEQKAAVYFDFWKTMVSWVNIYLDKIEDDCLYTALRPGGNHGVWLLGHLIICEDDLSEYLGKGPMLFPEYQPMFDQNRKVLPVEKYPSISVLRKNWQQVCEKNKVIYSQLKDDELALPHKKVEGDIEDNYFKTVEGCLKNWILHQIHHTGQLAALSAKYKKEKMVKNTTA